MSDSGVAVTIGFKRDEGLRHLMPLIEETFSGYFRPHTASALILQTEEAATPVVCVTGGFKEWQEQGLTLDDIRGPCCPLLEAEIVDEELLCTRTEQPDCSPQLLEWTLEYKGAHGFDVLILGELAVLLEGARGRRREALFRQLVPIRSTETSRTDPKHDFRCKALLALGWSVFGDHVLFTVRSYADLWLEDSGGFGGEAPRCARENTEELAQRVGSLVKAGAGLIDDVALDHAEGKRWIQEFSRIRRAFEVVPGIHLQ